MVLHNQPLPDSVYQRPASLHIPGTAWIVHARKASVGLLVLPISFINYFLFHLDLDRHKDDISAFQHEYSTSHRGSPNPDDPIGVLQQ